MLKLINYCVIFIGCMFQNVATGRLTLTLLMWRIGWAPNNVSKGQMEYNFLFKGLTNLGGRVLDTPVLVGYQQKYAFEIME
jgi:hypothetical protein